MLVLLLSVFAVISIYLDRQQQSTRLTKARVVAQQVANSLEVFSADRERALLDLLVTWPAFDPNPVDWFNAHASTMRAVLPGFDNILWADENQLIQWSISESNREQLRHQALASIGLQIDPNRETFSSHIKQQPDGHHYTYIGRSISPQEHKFGYVVASFDVHTTLLVMVGELSVPEFSFKITDGNRVLIQSGEIIEDDPLIKQPISFAKREWVMQLQSTHTGVTIGTIIFSVGASMSSLLCLILFRALRSAFRHSLTQIRYQAASESSLDAILIFQWVKNSLSEFNLVEANKVAQSIFAQPSEQLIQLNLKQVAALIGSPELNDRIVNVFESGQAYERYLQVDSKVISPEWIKVQAVKADTGIALTVRDVTSRFIAEQKLRRSEEKFRRLIDGLNGHFIYAQNADGVIEFVSSSVRDILGYEPEYFRVNYHRLICKSADNLADIKQQLRQGQRPEAYQIEIYSKIGEVKVIECRESPLLSDAGEFRGIEGIGRDVTQDIALQKQVHYQANHDQLTGLYNRFAFDRQLKLLLQRLRQQGGYSTLCFIDMDQFKLVNDSCGHPAGDELLRQVSKILSAGLGTEDILARVGGDEFCLVYGDCRIEQATSKLDKLLAAIGEYRFIWDDKFFYIGASIGVVEISTGSVSAQELIKAADDGCYQAKKQGKNRYFIYQDGDQDVSYKQSELELVNRIQQAIEKDNLELFQQPIVPLNRPADGLHYEILLRMPDGAGGYLSPALFIPVAERYGLMNKIDTWVVEQTLSLLEAHPRHVDNLSKCAINLSGLTLGDENMLSRIVQRLTLSSIPPEKICFEITETTAVINLATATDFIDSLRSIGAKFALDDFGAGMSSFTYLKNMAVDYVKIDGSFVRNMCRDKIDYASVKAIHEIASSMGKLTVAEFVSDNEIKQALTELGVSYGQGFGLGKPAPLLQLLASNHCSKAC